MGDDSSPLPYVRPGQKPFWPQPCFFFRGRPGRKKAKKGEECRVDHVTYIPLDRIFPGSWQPRREFDRAELEELASSLREHGLLQPLLVRPRDDGDYELIAGERRWRAALLAGFQEAPAVIKYADDREAAVLSLVENIQRRELHFFDEARAFLALQEKFGMTQEEVARALGISQAQVANKIRLLRLSQEIRDIISREKVGERQARALLRLRDPEEQKAVLEEILRRRLDSRTVEALVASRLRRRRRPPAPRAVKDLRIFRNTFRQAVSILQRGGIRAEMTEHDEGGVLEVRVRIWYGRGERR